MGAAASGDLTVLFQEERATVLGILRRSKPDPPAQLSRFLIYYERSQTSAKGFQGNDQRGKKLRLSVAKSRGKRLRTVVGNSLSDEQAVGGKLLQTGWKSWRGEGNMNPL